MGATVDPLNVILRALNELTLPPRPHTPLGRPPPSPAIFEYKLSYRQTETSERGLVDAKSITVILTPAVLRLMNIKDAILSIFSLLHSH